MVSAKLRLACVCLAVRKELGKKEIDVRFATSGDLPRVLPNIYATRFFFQGSWSTEAQPQITTLSKTVKNPALAIYFCTDEFENSGELCGVGCVRYIQRLRLQQRSKGVPHRTEGGPTA